MDFKPARDAFAAADVERLCGELARLYPQDREIPRLQEFAHFALMGGSMPEDVSEPTRVFLDTMAQIRLHQESNTPWERRPHRFVSRELDFIGSLSGVEGWSVAQALNRLVLDSIVPSRRCAVVGTMRNDGIYIVQWVAHHLALGCEHLFVYTNDNNDGSDDLLAILAGHGLVTVIESEVTGEVAPEVKAFEHALHLLVELREYEWALFVDSDEFLVPAERFDNSILNVLSGVADTYPDDSVAGICYDWLWFISDMVFERRPGLLCERFQHARPHWLSKCLIRPSKVESMRRQHHPEAGMGWHVVDSAFEPMDIAKIWDRRQPQYEGGRINHYWPRSFQEFAIKKARGAALGRDNWVYDRPYERFFGWNGYATPGNHYPTDPRLLKRIADKIDYLRTLDGVAAAEDRIEQNFPHVLARIADENRLREDYARSKVEPGPL